MFSLINNLPHLQIVQITTRQLRSDAVAGMQRWCPPKSSTKITLFDLSGVGNASESGISAMIFIAQGNANVGFLGANHSVQRKLVKLGLDKELRLFSDAKEALENPWVKRRRLKGTKAVVLAAGKGSRCAPLTFNMPKPMLPILGRPIIEHLLEHFGRFGLEDVVINPVYLGPQIIQHLKCGAAFGKHIQYANEGHFKGELWWDNAIGSASSLLKMHQENAAFFDDFFVFCGDALIDLNLAEMMEQHKRSGAAVTIAAQRVDPTCVEKFGIIDCNSLDQITAFQEKPKISEAISNLANTGIYIFNPSILDKIPLIQACDIGTHLLPKLLAEGVDLNVYQSTFTWLDVGCGKDFFDTNHKILDGGYKFIKHSAKEFSPGQFLSEGAEINSKAKVSGPVFLAENAYVDAGATINGPVFLGPNSIAEKGSFIKNSLLFQNTRAHSGAFVDGMITDGNWAFAHAFATAAALNVSPLDYVSSTTGIAKDGQQIEPVKLRIAS
ncbi:Putative sugar-phosphate nucleotidyl transferase [Rhodobacterales bacterium HTCC2150]|nr:Putative sugar-phosphate nucleotidyl transferase [Rhodobacterales bacterium HTCC2150] [Rhodobacteraceae bacterium HTCC2150]